MEGNGGTALVTVNRAHHRCSRPLPRGPTCPPHSPALAAAPDLLPSGLSISTRESESGTVSVSVGTDPRPFPPVSGPFRYRVSSTAPSSPEAGARGRLRMPEAYMTLFCSGDRPQSVSPQPQALCSHGKPSRHFPCTQSPGFLKRFLPHFQGNGSDQSWVVLTGPDGLAVGTQSRSSSLGAMLTWGRPSGCPGAGPLKGSGRGHAWGLVRAPHPEGPPPSTAAQAFSFRKACCNLAFSPKISLPDCASITPPAVVLRKETIEF